ncbi:50S ribosomal protein L10, partial [Streptomyces sp. NPDC086077]
LGENAQYAVVKNTLTKIAANEAGITLDDQLFAGPTAVAFVTGDPVESAKGLRDFAKDNPNLVIKGGVLDGKALSADEIKKLADLESREVLLSKLAGAFKGKQSQAASVFQALPSKLVRTVDALRAKQAEQGGAE